MRASSLSIRVILRIMPQPWWVCCAFVLLMPIAKGQELRLPTVFRLGEYESSYRLLLKRHPSTLIEVVDNDLDYAYKIWQSVLIDIEDAADREGVDLNGVRLYLNIFWTADGRIGHIAYFIKPNSRRIAEAEIVGILSKVIGTRTLRASAEQAFVHFGSASFPLVYVSRPVEQQSTGKPP